MKQLLFIFFLALGFVSYGQQDRFLFLQASKDQPFYVRLGEKTYSSSAFGHLVIPSLKDNNYQLFIGFPGNQLPEQEFNIQVSGKDRGLDLRIENRNQLFLYDWQTMQLIRSVTPPVAKAEVSISGTKRTDPFARLMAGVVNDSLVLYTEKPRVKDAIASTPNKKTDSVFKSEAVKDTSSLAKTVSPVTPTNTSMSKQDTAVIARVERKDTVMAKTEDNAAVAAAQTVRGIDTVSTLTKSDSIGTLQKDPVAIPAIDASAEVKPAISIVSEETTPEEKRITYQVESTKERIDIIIPKDVEQTAVVDKKEVEKQDTSLVKDTASAIVLMNSDCNKFATDSDVDRLRVQMLKEGSDDEKVFAARKVFKTRCFSTKQIIALTELFTTDEGRYMFFDAAYPFVSDSGNFKSLIRFLSNEYYINRFKALVRM